MKPTRSNPLFARYFRAGLTSLIVVSSAAFAADSISINFGSDRSSSQIDEAGKTSGAIPIDGTLWNNPAGASGADVAVTADAGLGGTVTWTSNNLYGSASTGATATSENGDLYKDYLDDGGGVTISVSSPYLLNNIYLMPGTDQGDPATISAMSINGIFYKGNGAGGTILASGSGDSWSAQNWTAADTLVESTNFIKVLAQPGVEIASLVASPGRASIAGIQVENAYSGTYSYWDTNGATPGSGDAGGTWGTDTFWSTSADGTVAPTTAWTPGNAAVFSAGTDNSSNTVTINGTQAADAVWVQEGDISLDSGTLDLSAGLGILRADGGGVLTVNSNITANNLTTVGFVDLNGTNTVAGTATIGGYVYLGSNHTFPKMAGAGTLNIGTFSLTVGDATDSTFGGEIVGSGAFTKIGTGSLTLGNVSTGLVGPATVSAGTLNISGAGNLVWDINGAGNFAKSGAGQLNLESDISTAGTLSVQGGIFQLGNVSDLGTIGTPSGITIGNATLRYRHDTMADTLSSPVTLAANGSVLEQYAGSATGSLTISGSVTGTASDANGDAVDGTLSSYGGNLVFASGATAEARDLRLTNGNVTVEAGANLTLRYVNIGNAGGASGIVTQTGGDVTMEAGGNAVRIGHWSGAGRAYNISGGTFDATALAANTGDARYIVAGWDGEGDMTIGGGAGAATVKCVGLIFDRNRAGLGNSSSTATLLPNGVIEVGNLGIAGQGDDDGLVMSGGLVRGTASSTWNTPMATTTATSSTIDIGSGSLVTYTKPISGDGALTKTGAGTLVLPVAGATYSGALTVSGGTLKVSGDSIPTASSVTVTSGGTIGSGTAGAVGPGTVTTLNLDAGSSSNFRVGPTSDKLVVFGTNGLTTAATHTISVQPTGALAVSDVFPVIDYDGTIQGAGFGGLSLAALPNPHYSLSLVDNVGNTTVDVEVTAVDPVIWAGPGAWNLVNSNWTDSGGASQFYSADIATFNDLGATESVVVDTNGGVDPIAPAVMIFNNTTATTYTVSGDPISGISGLTKTGDGTVILTNNNTFTGAIDIQAGTLQIGDGGTSGSLSAGGAISVASLAEIVFNRTDASTLARSTTGDGTLVIDSGNLTISAGNNSTNMVINGGTLLARGGAWATGFDTGKTITVNSGGTLDTVVHSLGGLGAAGILPGLIDLNGGTWLLNNEQYINNLTMTGGLTTGAGEIRTTGGGLYIINASAGGSTMAARLSMTGAKTIQVADGLAATDLLISGAITNSGALTKTGPGKLVTSGTNTSSGAINVNEGEVIFTGDNSGRTGGTTLNGTTLNTASVSAAAIGSGFLALNNGTLNYSGTGSETTTRLLWIDTGSGTFNVSSASGVLTMNPSGGTVNMPVIKNGPGRLRLQGAITGAASVTANGGRLSLEGANTYSGETTVNGGATIDFALANLDDASTVNINLTGKLNLDHGQTDVVAALYINGALQLAGKTYGSTSSGADVQDDVHFAGTGVIEIPSAGTPYDTWLTLYTFAGGADTTPTGDPDNDGMSNQDEFAFGTDPTSGASVSPISEQLDKTTGVFKYTRYASSGLTYSIKTSTNLTSWALDAGATASQVAGPVDGLGNQEVTVTITGAPLTAPKFFVRVTAE